MFGFQGDSRSNKKVNLRGNSRAEDNREKTINQIRQKKARRKRHNIENEKAAIIQVKK